ncbi:hypothetical protein MTO96_001240 [Rhipicephalus appendiculatus]
MIGFAKAETRSRECSYDDALFSLLPLAAHASRQGGSYFALLGDSKALTGSIPEKLHSEQFDFVAGKVSLRSRILRHRQI